METIEQGIQGIFASGSLIQAVLSSPLPGSKDGAQKVSIRRIQPESRSVYHFEIFRDKQSFHENHDAAGAAARCTAWLKDSFRQAVFFCSEADYQYLVSRKGAVSCIKRPASKKAEAVPSAHNRQRHYLLQEGTPVPWLVELGIMKRDGSVYKNSYHKFRQVNRYLEFIEDVLDQLPRDRPIRIVDFGCGKAALSFALYDWLVNHKKLQAEICGLDLKADIIKQCAGLSRKLGFDGLRFERGDIADWEAAGPVDMVICLHACDTATDAALARAVYWGAKVIFAVPCCQKELIQKIDNAAMAPLLGYGLLRERFGSLATDTLRALALEVMGYKTQVLEFIETEHTPKNILIRAVRGHGVPVENTVAAAAYRRFRDSLAVKPWLEKALGSEFAAAIGQGAALEPGAVTADKPQ